MKKLASILGNIKIINPLSDTSILINGITADSRLVEMGFLFVAIKGHSSNGHTFISNAIELGATVIVCENMPEIGKDNVTYIQVKDAAEALGIMAHHFYNEPSKQLKLVGITGTNGKTTTATLCYHLFEALGFKTGLLSTIENRIHTTRIPSTHTTPDPVQLNALLAKMVSAGCDYAFMEVSSHAAEQKRIAGLHFCGGVFTNITHDHLDYHRTFEQYISAKKSFFDQLPSSAFALVNSDDKRGRVMLQNTKASHHTFSIKAKANFNCRIQENNLSGLVLSIDGEEFHTALVGEFNAWNILAVYGIGRLLNFDRNTILASLSGLSAVEGRADTVLSLNKQITGIIDYAHTPDAVEKILSTLKKALKGNQNIITVIGCGGDRDTAKRPIMARVAATLSDKIILTSDNPRSEEPMSIINAMEEGLDQNMRTKSLSIADRKEAIKTAVMLCKNGDVILVAGKGHEKYQEIKGIKYPFDDKKVLIETFKTLSK